MTDETARHPELTPREMDILRLLAEKLTDREVAERLVLSRGTVKWYNRQLYNKLGVNSREEAVAAARELGILHEARALPNNLPAPVTPFVGREPELSALLRLINDTSVRLISIIGVGGMGKTRLALEAGRALLGVGAGPRFTDGIYFIDLAPVDDAQGIFAAIADALRFRFQADSHSPERQVLNHLKDRDLLLILDNFEHLLDSVESATRILHEGPKLQFLVTSRERLKLGGETVLHLGGMDYPVERDAEHALDYSAVQLFVRSAQRTRHDFALKESSLPHLLRICQLVEGMPLGIILAASWVEVLSLAEIEEQLTHSIDFLASEQRDLPRRLRSIRAVFDYSWSRMSDQEAAAFMQLCVFRGGFTSEAAQDVAGADLHNLVSLTGKSLIEYDHNQGRYSVHELLRQYAAQHLQSTGRWDQARRKHAEYYTHLAERAEPELRSADQEHWFGMLESEHDNLRAALAWLLNSGEAQLALRLVVALRDFWFYQGYHVEGYRWCELALQNARDVDPILRGRLHLTLGLLAWARHEMQICWSNWEDALALFEEAGARRYAAWARGLLGGSKWGDDRTGYESDVKRLETSISELRAVGDMPGVAQMLTILGNVYRIPHDYEQAKAAYEACLDVIRQTGERRRACIMLNNLALVAYSESRFDESASLSRDCVRISQEIEFEQLTLFGLRALVGPLAATGQITLAATLLGATTAHMQSRGISAPPNDHHYYEQMVDDVRRQVDDATYRRALEEGYGMPLAEAIDLVLKS